MASQESQRIAEELFQEEEGSTAEETSSASARIAEEIFADEGGGEARPPERAVPAVERPGEGISAEAIPVDEPEGSLAGSAIRGALAVPELAQMGGALSGPNLPTTIARTIKTGSPFPTPLAERLGVPEGEEGLRGKLVEEGAAALTTGGPVLGLARRGATSGGRFLGSQLRRAAEQPGRFVAEEVAGATGAAVGREVGEEAGPVGELAGGAAGGTGGTLIGSGLDLGTRGIRGVGRFAANLAFKKEDPLRAVSKRTLDEKVKAGEISAATRDRVLALPERQRAGEILQKASGDRHRSVAELDRVEAVRAEFGIPKDSTTVGASTGAPGIKDLEARIVRTDPELALKLNLARTSGNAAARKALIELGDTPGDAVTKSQRAAELYVDRRMRASREAIERRGGDPDVLSEEVATELTRLEREFAEQMREGYDAVDEAAEAAGLVYPTGFVSNAVKKMNAAAGKFEKGDVPKVARQLQKDGLGETMTFGDLRSLRRRINQDLRAAGRKQQRNKIRLLSILQDGVQEALDFVGVPGVSDPTPAQKLALATLRRRGPLDPRYADIAAEYRNVNAAFKAGSARFREGASGQALKDPASAALSLYFKTGKGALEAGQQFRETFRESPAAIASMHRYILQKAFDSSHKAGVLDPQKLKTFRLKHRSALRSFPEAQEALENVRGLGVEAEKLGLAAPRSRNAVSRGAVALFVEDPVEAVDKVLRTPNPGKAMRALRRQLGGDTEAVDGLRRIFWDQLDSETRRTEPFSTGSSEGIDPVKFTAFLNKHEDAFLALYSREHLNRTRRLGRIVDEIAQVPALKKATEPEPAETFTAGAIKSGGLFTRILNPALRTARFSRFLARFANQVTDREAFLILRETIQDENLARDLLTATTPEKQRRLVHRIATNVPTLAGRVPLDGEDERQRPPLKNKKAPSRAELLAAGGAP